MVKKRNYREEYDSYQGTEKQKKRRAKRNAARRKMEKAGKVHKGDGRDVDHADRRSLSNSSSKLRVRSKSANRSYSRKKENHGKRGKT